MRNKFWRVMVLEWSTMLQYRADMILWLTGEAAMPLVSLAIWYNVAQASTAGPTPREILTYYVLLACLKIMTDSWSGFVLSRDILSGDLVKYLVRPLFVFWQRIANELTEKVFKMLFPLPVLFFLLTFAPSLFSPEIYKFWHIAAFLVSLPLAMVLNFLMDMCIGCLAFWLEDVLQLRRYKILLESVASGLLIPFAMMPEWLNNTFSFLPFRYFLALPAELLLGQVAGTDALRMMAIQGVWIVGLVFLLRFEWVQGLRRYAVPGQ